MAKELHLTSTDYSLALSIFFIVSICSPSALVGSDRSPVQGIPPQRGAVEHATCPLEALPLPSCPHARMGKTFSHIHHSLSTQCLKLNQGACSVGAKGINSLGGLVAFRFFLGKGLVTICQDERSFNPLPKGIIEAGFL